MARAKTTVDIPIIFTVRFTYDDAMSEGEAILDLSQELKDILEDIKDAIEVGLNDTAPDSLSNVNINMIRSDY
jgi:predicted RNase H-like HicB family nuclease